MTLHEAVCFRCDHVFEVAGEVPDMWRCPDCQDAYEEAADEHEREVWNGGNGPQNDRERDEVTR